jgi:hypothetical protein
MAFDPSQPMEPPGAGAHLASYLFAARPAAVAVNGKRGEHVRAAVFRLTARCGSYSIRIAGYDASESGGASMH